MSLPFNRRAFLPACLTLGALLGALPVLADAPAAQPVAGAAQTLVLQHVVPGDILKVMHWDQAAGLPAGVTRISAQPATNSLAVVATPAGLTKVRELVRILDFAPRQVQIKFATADATDADMKAAGINFDLVLLGDPKPGAVPAPVFVMYGTGDTAGGSVAGFQQTLAKRGAVTEGPAITTSNNVNATFKTTTTVGPQRVLSATFDVTPRINSDDSVILDLHPVFQTGTVKREIKTLRTVKSGDTLVIVMPPTAAAGKSLLLFVTPTILPTGKGLAVMTVK